MDLERARDRRPHSEPRLRGRDNWWPKYYNITGNTVVKVGTVGALKLERVREGFSLGEDLEQV